MKKISELKPGAFAHSHSSDADNAEPIRGELFSVERLEQFAVPLAEDHRSAAQPKTFRKLMPRLEDNGKVLVAAYHSLAEAIGNGRAISPAAEWLVDNFHIIEEQLREVREDLPQSFYRELPKLTVGELAGYPRIYAVALAIIAHTDSRLESDTLERFLKAYQKITPLTIGELWATAITLRVALVENLRRLAKLIVTARAERDEADTLADKLLKIAENQPDEIMPVMTESLGKRKRLGHAFIAQFARRLREQDPSINPAFDWLEQQLAKQNESSEQIVRLEHQRQAATQITVGNIITSMRLLSTLDWRDFFESVSLIDPILKRDAAKIYAEMDFASRDRYRDVIERIAKRTKSDELKVGRSVVELSEKAYKAHPKDKRRSHIGYYLIGDGLAELENEFNYRPRLAESFKRFVLRRPTAVYLGLTFFLTALILTLLVSAAAHFGAHLPLLIVFAVISLIPVSDLALSVLNFDFTLFIPPRVLPQMDTMAAVPDDARTMVVIPTLFSSAAGVRELLEKLEVHYLANQDKNLYFALLGDFTDAPTEEMPSDDEIFDAAERGIDILNEKHGKGGDRKFYVFLRRRLWNESERKWMGWERKRGKLEEFNSLLRGAKKTSFIGETADKKFLKQIKYVITLDSDTQLPRDAARKLIGIAAHPLNRPHFDEKLKRVTEGYGILQPRVSISLTSAARSRFARIFSGNTGIDPYTTASSDVYQDLFGEGSFTGKGLYDVDAFEKSLAGRVPENSILSHDLFEGLYARCGLVSNIELLDDFPTFYDSFAQRGHRWVRGDWQIARWIFPYVKNADGNTVKNHLPLISRWKIFDNLRRSLVAPTMFLWLLMVWTLIPGSPIMWTLFVLIELAFPIYTHLTSNLLTHPKGVPWTSHFWSLWGDVRTNTAQVLLAGASIAHQAYTKIDAIMRTLYRKFISRKNLLEWTTAAQSERENPHDQASFLRSMQSAMVLAVISFALILWLRPAALIIAAPFLLAWFLSPLIMYRISRPAKTERVDLSPAAVQTTRLIARRTWRFFETFVGDDDNWLPPDNFQEDPDPVIAHRTSPTNMGMLLLSTVAAHDFGYLGTLELTERLRFTFDTLEKLDKYRGQFFNWYDTQNLAPLNPRYISTVDSGNLAGHLLAVKQSVLEITGKNLFDTRIVEGLTDTVLLIREEAAQLNTTRRRTSAVTVKNLLEEVDVCAEILKTKPDAAAQSWRKMLDILQKQSVIITDMTSALAQEHGDIHYKELRFWSADLLYQTRAYLRDIETFFPWNNADFTKLEGAVSRDFPDLTTDWNEISGFLKLFPSLAELTEVYEAVQVRLVSLKEKIRAKNGQIDLTAFENFANAVKNAATIADNTLAELNEIALKSEQLVEEMDFSFLLDKKRKVFVIGYNVEAEKPDNSFYDLLASESRLASFVAIAKGDAPQEHWFRLGRALTPVDGSRALISWTATMFEYLMPILVMRDYDKTLLAQTYKAVVARQIEYGAKNKVPWGVSEAAYNARDLQFNYQYAPFGIPGLGLKRGLSEDLVVSPYSTALAAQIAPLAALENFQTLTKNGMLARFGFYESVDYTPERLPPDADSAIIKRLWRIIRE